jgi:hypothetical protein
MLPRAEALMKRPAMNEAGKKAVLLAKNEGVDLADPKKSLLGMHYMKLALDDMIEGAGQQGFGGTYKRGLVGLKNQLVGIMDELSPDYAKARKVFAHYSPNVTSVKEGVTTLAELATSRRRKAARCSSAGTSRRTRSSADEEALRARRREGHWDQMRGPTCRTPSSRRASSSRRRAARSMQAPNWQVAMTGSPRQYRILEKAMEPAQFQAFKDMMDVFEAMGRTRGAGAGSQTMGRQEGAKLLREESGAGLMGKAAQLRALRTSARGRRVAAGSRVGDHAEKLAEIMTSPDGMKRLRELKRLSPNDQRFLAGASALFGVELKPANKPADQRRRVARFAARTSIVPPAPIARSRKLKDVPRSLPGRAGSARARTTTAAMAPR